MMFKGDQQYDGPGRKMLQRGNIKQNKKGYRAKLLLSSGAKKS